MFMYLIEKKNNTRNKCYILKPMKTIEHTLLWVTKADGDTPVLNYAVSNTGLQWYLLLSCAQMVLYYPVDDSRYTSNTCLVQLGGISGLLGSVSVKIDLLSKTNDLNMTFNISNSAHIEKITPEMNSTPSKTIIMRYHTSL